MKDANRKAMYANRIETNKESHIDKFPRVTGRLGLNDLGNNNLDMYKKMVGDLEDKALQNDFYNPIKHQLDFEANESKLKIDRFNVKSKIDVLEKSHKEGIKTKNSLRWLKFLKKYKLQFTQ
jgi:hypothetical protein